MAIYKRDIVDINLETGNIHRSFLKHSIGYLDQAADHFGIRVLRNGEPVDLTGVTVQGIFMPPQGNPIAITTGNIIEGNVAEVVLPQACYNYDGQFCLSIKLVDATNAITGTMRIVDGMVDNTHASGTVAPTETVPTYQEILAVYADMVTALVTVDELDDEVSDLKSAMDQTTGRIGFLPNEIVLGSINTNTGADASSTDGTRLRTSYIEVDPSKTYNMVTTNNSSAQISRKLCWYDANKTWISPSVTIANVAAGDSVTYSLTPVTGAKYLRIRYDGTGMTPTSVELNIYDLDTGMIQNYGVISKAGFDLNTGVFIRPGMWAVSNVDYLPTNWPTGASTGRIVSFASQTVSSFGTIQMVVDAFNKIFFRFSYSNGNWQTWKEITSKAELDEVDEKALSDGGLITTEGLDLDEGDFIHPGMWSINNMTYAPDHYPSNTIGRIISFASTTNSSYGTMQIVIDSFNSVYIRSSWKNGSWTNWMQVSASTSSSYLNPFAVLPADTRPYIYEGVAPSYITGSNKLAQLYALYDDLVERFPDYIRKSVIGRDATDTFDINMYTIEPYQNSGYPEIIWISNVHGNEPICAIATYYLCKLILENKDTDDRFRAIFNSVCLLVVPAGNPYGFNASSRDNGNNVNINRDFPVNWSYLNTEAQHTGTTSMSQAETQAIMALIEAHKQNTLLVMNRHDTGWISSHKESSAWWHFIGYMVSLKNSVYDSMKSVSKLMDGYAREKIGDEVYSVTGYTSWKNLPAYPVYHTGSAVNGTLDDYVNYIGVPAMLLEQCSASGPDFGDDQEYIDAELFKLSISISVNVVLDAIFNNERILTSMENNKNYIGYTGKEEGGEIVRVPLEYDPTTGTWTEAE